MEGDWRGGRGTGGEGGGVNGGGGSERSGGGRGHEWRVSGGGE